MRLKWARRVALAGIGAVLLGIAVLGAAMGWSDGVMIALIPFGLFMLVFAVLGVVPSGNWKEGNFHWPEKDLLARVDEISGQVGELVKNLEQAVAMGRASDERLNDLILALEPVPEDGLTDEERLDGLEEARHSTDLVVSQMAMDGSDYEDGSTYAEWRSSLQSLREDYDKEVRRQRARRSYRIARI